MARTTLTGPLGTLSVEREMTPVSYLTDIDAGWRYTDAAGHEHHCDYDAAVHYPTLTRVTVTGEAYWCGDCEDQHEDEDTHLECHQCGEEIAPGMTGPGMKYLRGRITCTLNGEIISEERAAEIAAGWKFSG